MNTNRVDFKGFSFTCAGLESEGDSDIVPVSSFFRIHASHVSGSVDPLPSDAWIYGRFLYFFEYCLGDTFMQIARVELYKPPTIDTKSRLPVIDTRQTYAQVKYIYIDKVDKPVAVAEHPGIVFYKKPKVTKGSNQQRTKKEVIEQLQSKMFVLLIGSDNVYVPE